MPVVTALSSKARQNGASARRTARRLFACGAVTITLSLTGCASADKGLLQPIEKTDTQAKQLTMLAVTTRKPEPGKTGFMFGHERDSTVHFVRLTMSMPKGREAGTLPVSTSNPDPKTDITLLNATPLSYAQFKAETAMPKTTAGKAANRAMIFTHGFNTRFDQAAVRYAQIIEDTGFDGRPILFSWPSHGIPTGYGYDKDSANYSRDALQQLIDGLAREKSLERVDIFAHSMGTWLTMETLRQMALSKDKAALDRIGTVILAAPDIDLDVFRTQVSQLGPLSQRIKVYVSADDRALQLSRRLFGGKIRAGETTDLAQFRALGIEAYDISEVKGGFGKNHNKAFGDGQTIASIGQSLSNRPGLISSSLQQLVVAVPRLDDALLIATDQNKL
ncbi:alpha/beta hydrolase [Rhizobium sp. SL86]|uniref:alpha/beta hydrolase n=1 Tax=Rhizobium sp. SL86 TaxID=2995148 RepID=UPI002272CE52|nr:alpha/beta fold hydrolase [Rhizobium sp. SL86]MCY1666375.1 alpha/beta fold hydrolase [Rhizobium sp. SL86]